MYGRKPVHEKTCIREFANKENTDQSAHPPSLISIFVICLLERTISILATSKIAFLLLVSVAEETDLSLAVSETPKTGYVASGR